MSLEAQRKEGAKPQAPGAGGRELPSPYHLAKGQLDETSPWGAGSHCTHTPFLLHTCLCHTAARLGMSGDPCLGSAACLSLWERSCQVGAVGLTPVGGQLSQELQKVVFSF